MAAGFAVNLNVEGRRALVVGSGEEAERKAASLAECGARVERRATYAPGCAAGFFLVIAAGLSRAENAQLFEEGERERVLVNCLDDPPHCRFTFPSVLRRGALQIAISTAGRCPALAVRLRERLERELGPEYAEFLDLALAEREPLAARVAAFGARKRIWYELVDSDVLALLRQGDRAAALAVWRSIAGG